MALSGDPPRDPHSDAAHDAAAQHLTALCRTALEVAQAARDPLERAELGRQVFDVLQDALLYPFPPDAGGNLCLCALRAALDDMAGEARELF